MAVTRINTILHRITLFLILFNSTSIFCQETEIYNHFRIESEDGYRMVQSLGTKKPDIDPFSDKFYYWCDRNNIHFTQGGFSFYLLHGPYEVFDANGQLIEKGIYDMGLKSGRWLKWQANGLLKEEAEYTNGELNGLVNFYDTQGKVIKSANYKDGELDGRMLIYKSDSVMLNHKYRNGRLVESSNQPDRESEPVIDDK